MCANILSKHPPIPVSPQTTTPHSQDHTFGFGGENSFNDKVEDVYFFSQLCWVLQLSLYELLEKS